ncbi:MAG: hypothetical protein V7606_2318 [Burkholderiales bacterium]|jgi:hypothetical protein
MRAFNYRTVVAGTLIAALLLPVETAHAQLEGLLKKGESAGSAGGGGGIGEMGSGLSAQSLTAGSTGNVAGLLQYCISNNYLGGEGASSVKDKLMGKVSGGSPSSDSGYKDGAKGLLNSSSGKRLDLSGGGMNEQVTKQICEKVLAQGKSLL